MENFLKVTLLAILQGLTEFLPVSSSGHLELLTSLFKFKASDSMTLSIMLHAGSLCTIVVFYFKTLWSLLKKENFHIIGLIILGSIPAGIFGVTLKLTGYDAMLSSSLPVVGFGFLITAALLRLSSKEKLIQLAPGEAPKKLSEMSWRQALTVGVVQAVAIVPGISRSGSTISCGIITGIERESAAAFSFLLALPAIGGAALLELYGLIKGTGTAMEVFTVPQLVWGVILSAIVSFGALSLLMNFVKKGKLIWFSWYLNILGAAVLLYCVAGMIKR
ncbi:MAG: undecaprenyl-diphosphate phosphatase [Lentisphaeria bacterium]|nr:undecaprenyl-diphosphate phosphatase [Lentisphaeria bacterium]